MAIQKTFVKDPHALLDFHMEWAAWLEDDTLASSTWIVPEGIDKVKETMTATRASVWLSGGSVGASYAITNRITTTEGKSDDRTIKIRVMER